MIKYNSQTLATKCNSNSKTCSQTIQLKTVLNIALVLLTTISLSQLFASASRTRFRNKLDVRFNYECPPAQCSSKDEEISAINLFQVTSKTNESPEKTNFILSNIGGPPMVIISSSSKSPELKIDWPVILGNQTTNNTDAFHFDTPQDSSIGLLFEEIIIFDDEDRSGKFTNTSKFFKLDWNTVIWDLASRTTYLKDDFLKISLRTRPNCTAGNIQIRLAIPRDIKADRQKEVPHLKLGAKSMSIVAVIDSLKYDKNQEKFKHPRLMMTLAVVTKSPLNSLVSYDKVLESLISDEYTSGIFRIKSLQFKSEQLRYARESSQEEFTKQVETASESLGFFYWKEVAYTDRHKIISRTVDVFDSNQESEWSTIPNTSAPFYHYFSYEHAQQKSLYQLHRINFVYGKGDVSYSTTNFTDFSFILGLGQAPHEQMFSFLVKMIIFVCFCLPILVTLAGVAHVLLRRFRRNGDTELLLAADS